MTLKATIEPIPSCGSCAWWKPRLEEVDDGHPPYTGNCTFSVALPEGMQLPASVTNGAFEKEVMCRDEGSGCPCFKVVEKEPEQRCWNCVHFNATDSPTSCAYPPTNGSQAALEFIAKHHAHPVPTSRSGGDKCAVFSPRVPAQKESNRCGDCRWFAPITSQPHYTHGDCNAPLPECAADTRYCPDQADGAECKCFDRKGARDES